MFGLTASGFSSTDLDRFREHQRTSFAVLEAVAATLRAGETEKAVARRIHRRMKAAGAQNYFYVPVRCSATARRTRATSDSSGRCRPTGCSALATR